MKFATIMTVGFMTFAMPSYANEQLVSNPFDNQQAISNIPTSNTSIKNPQPIMIPSEKTVTASSDKTCVKVWANMTSHVYHTQNSRWFGHTKHGEFMCEQDADRQGFRKSSR